MSHDDTRRTGRTIFRPSALERLASRGQQTVLPRIVAPRTFLVLWILLALVVAAGVVAWLTDVPVVVSGPAVVVDGTGTGLGDGLLLVIFLSVDERARVRAGQTVRLADGSTAGPLSVARVEDTPWGPEDARRRLGLDGAAAAVVARPATVVVAPFAAPDDGVPPAGWVGSVLPVEITVGERSVLSMLPGMSPVSRGSGSDGP